LERDLEKKITEFEYEKFLPKEALTPERVNDPNFKEFVKAANFYSKTQYELF
jgi:hypothetical protein